MGKFIYPMGDLDYLTQADSPHLLWMLFCFCLLIFMQMGFGCLEAGLVRGKNSINVIMKNCLDFCISVLLFLFVGYAVMFAPLARFGELAMGQMLSLYSEHIIAVLFHTMYCATAVTVISGAVVERMTLRGYLTISAVTAVLIYPICGRLVWGNLFYSDNELVLLGAMGFYDFAGASLIHALGGAIALACIVKIGPRLGKFGDDSQPIRPSSIPLAYLGVFLLWIGWIGFNGGSQLMLSPQTPRILLTTMLGGITGLATAAIYTKYQQNQLDILPILSGALAGLVSITAGADLLTPWQAVLVSGIAGLFPSLLQQPMTHFRLDDGIGVIPVHLAGGIWGTLAVGLFRPLAAEETRLQAFGTQCIGIVAIVSIAFLLAWFLLTIASRFMQFRVSSAGEMIGLNIWEHRASTAQIDLIQQMSVQAELGLFNHRIAVEPYTQEHDIARFYNSVLDKFNEIQDEKEQALQQAIWLAEHDALTGLKNRRAMTQALAQEQARLDRNDSRSVVAIMDLDHFKKINDQYGHDRGDKALQHFATIVKPLIRKSDQLSRIGGEEFVLFMPDTNIQSAVAKLDSIRHHIASQPLPGDNADKSFDLAISVSIGAAELQPGGAFENSLKAADQALYQAKQQGRNCVVCAPDSASPAQSPKSQ